MAALGFWTFPEPRKAKNRKHLDLNLDDGTDGETERQRTLALGARQISEHHEYGNQRVCLQDPEGNEFDLSAGH
ncbi:VOC family protein [Kineosporia succinea]|uniref:Glyoxalase-like domain-containing protein n=1 Tax=Kineosporia succinea TaxID=84632 RepID=A0ABT9PB43_9ACTN|nr:VOC family protein [Kineosporia succinea]MDP9829924.1 hypothetical protein [Kineosporia succinea]